MTDAAAPRAIVERMRFAMRVLAVGGLAMAAASASVLVLTGQWMPLELGLCALFAIQALVAFVAAAALRRFAVDGNALDVRRGLVAITGWLVLAALVVLVWSLPLELLGVP